MGVMKVDRDYICFLLFISSLFISLFQMIRMCRIFFRVTFHVLFLLYIYLSTGELLSVLRYWNFFYCAFSIFPDKEHCL